MNSNSTLVKINLPLQTCIITLTSHWRLHCCPEIRDTQHWQSFHPITCRFVVINPVPQGHMRLPSSSQAWGRFCQAWGRFRRALGWVCTPSGLAPLLWGAVHCPDLCPWIPFIVQLPNPMSMHTIHCPVVQSISSGYYSLSSCPIHRTCRSRSNMGKTQTRISFCVGSDSPIRTRLGGSGGSGPLSSPEVWPACLLRVVSS